MSFENITIVCVDGRISQQLRAQYALVKSGIELPGAKLLLLSPNKPEFLFDGIQHKKIQMLGYFDYSIFIIYCLQAFIETDYALVIQDDGWVLNGKNWNNDFYNYDYIGAPTHLAKVTNLINSESEIIGNFFWTNHISTNSHNIQFVMNGGFSLRSKKLLRAPTELNLSYILPAPSIKANELPNIYWKSDSQNEDVQLCINMRASLEAYGITYPPLDVAKFFSFEQLCPKLHNNLTLNSALGHHSKYRKLFGLDPLKILYTIPHKSSNIIYGEDSVTKLLKNYGYEVSFTH